MDSVTEETVVEADYEAPTVIELGSLVEVTNGGGDEWCGRSRHRGHEAVVQLTTGRST
ncbi:MAG TPA: lasso RiPP family leader peptide-containing protein [Pseudonocardiaceae bacterium]